MAQPEISYTGDGTTVLFSFTFPYLDQSHVKVSLNETATTAYTFANATTLQMNTAPEAGVIVRIFRQTTSTSLEAQFFPGSAIRAQDLNKNFTQNLFVTQESSRDITEALNTAGAADATANAAISTANTALSTANTASSDASAAVATANTALSSASAAVNTANSASSDASDAVNIATSAESTADTASATATTALSTADLALSEAAAAASDATSAILTADTALAAAVGAVDTADTASNTATTAFNTANAAATDASAAVLTANNASTTANAAAAAVAAAVFFTPVADLTALLALTPADGDFFELNDSTGAESEPSIVGIPSGLIGDPGLSFRLRYGDPPGEFVFLGYLANNPETRYANINDGATGAGLDRFVFQNHQTIFSSYSLLSGRNAFSVGALEIQPGAEITVPVNSTWVII